MSIEGSPSEGVALGCVGADGLPFRAAKVTPNLEADLSLEIAWRNRHKHDVTQRYDFDRTALA